MKHRLHMTNATKALVIGLVNASIAVAIAFGVHLSDAQIGAVVGETNAILMVWVGVTRNSPSRRAQ